MSTKIDQFRALFPEFEKIAAARVRTYIELATAIFNKGNKATLYLAAHLLVLAEDYKMGDANGQPHAGETQNLLALASARIDSKSVSFIAMCKNATDNFYTTTLYGLIFLQLRRACANYVFALGVAGNESTG